MLRKKGRSLLGLSVILMITCAASLGAGELEKGTYTVRKGDTLWHISGTYLQNPRLWPKVWEMNRYIKNPNLIYPGDPITLPGQGAAPAAQEGTMAPVGTTQAGDLATAPEAREEGMAAPQEGAAAPESKQGEEASQEIAKPPALELPPYQPAPQVTPQIVADCGFIGKEDILRERRRIVKPIEDINELSAGDWVIVNIGPKEGVKVGDQFSILRPTRKVHHPLRGGRLGILVLNVGRLEIKEVMENSSKAEIAYSYTSVAKGDCLIPYQTPVFPFDLKPEPASTKVKGCIVVSRDEKGALGGRDIVYIDLGAKQGIKPGDIFSISRPDVMPRGLVPRGAQPPSTLMGELVVLRSTEQASTGLILESSGEIERGDRVSLEKRIP